jgi:hypothetical protein
MFKRICKKVAVPVVLMFLIGIAYAVQTVLTPQVLKENNYQVIAGDLALTETACDNTNGNSFAFTGREILVVHNTDASLAHTFTVTSVADSLGRTDTSLTGYSVPLSAIAVIHLDAIAGWRQSSNGTILLACNSNLIKFGVLRLPG